MEGCMNILKHMKKFLFYFISIVLLSSGCEKKPYVIVQIADSQLGFTAMVQNEGSSAEYVNDLTYESECLKKAVAYVNKIMPDVIVFTGDQVNISDNQEQWETFAAIISEISEGIKVLHVPGNHDLQIGDAHVDMSQFSSRYGEGRFVHSDSGVNIVGMNTNLIKYDDPVECEQMDWLKTVLSRTTRDEVTLVFGHHPFFETDIDEEDTYSQITQCKRRMYFDVFKEHGVDAVYAGHCHESHSGEYNGIPMKTTTSVAYQLGTSASSVRVITVKDGQLSDELVEII